MKQINEEKSVYIDAEGFKEKIIGAHNKIIEENPATLIISDVLKHFGALIAGELFGYVEEDEGEETKKKIIDYCEKYGVEPLFQGKLTKRGYELYGFELVYREELDGIERRFWSKNYKPEDFNDGDFDEIMKDFVLEGRKMVRVHARKDEEAKRKKEGKE